MAWIKPSKKDMAVTFSYSQLRAFLGCCNSYHEFLPLYAKLSCRMTELLKVGKIEGKKGSQVTLKWTPECEEAFTGLKLTKNILISSYKPITL